MDEDPKPLHRFVEESHKGRAILLLFLTSTSPLVWSDQLKGIIPKVERCLTCSLAFSAISSAILQISSWWASVLSTISFSWSGRTDPRKPTLCRSRISGIRSTSYPICARWSMPTQLLLVINLLLVPDAKQSPRLFLQEANSLASFLNQSKIHLQKRISHRSNKYSYNFYNYTTLVLLQLVCWDCIVLATANRTSGPESLTLPFLIEQYIEETGKKILTESVKTTDDWPKRWWKATERFSHCHYHYFSIPWFKLKFFIWNDGRRRHSSANLMKSWTKES